MTSNQIPPSDYTDIIRKQANHIAELERQLDAAQAIVARMKDNGGRMTKDGYVPLPGETLWCLWRGQALAMRVSEGMDLSFCDPNYEDPFESIEDCYSTYEAALAARKETNEH